MDGTIPSAFTALFFIPIIFVAYRYPLGVAATLAIFASALSSPAMTLAGVHFDDSVRLGSGSAGPPSTCSWR